MPLPVIGSMTTERWFRQRGLVTLLDGTGVESTAGVRAAPALVVLFLVIMLWGVPDLLGVPLLPGALIAIGTIVVTWVLANLARRRRPFAPVARIGWIEALAFVCVPSALALFSPRIAFTLEDGVPDMPEGMWRAVFALTSAILLFLILAAVYLVVVSGLGSLVSLLVRELLGAVSRTGGTLATVIPVLLGFVFFFFLNPSPVAACSWEARSSSTWPPCRRSPPQPSLTERFEARLPRATLQLALRHRHTARYGDVRCLTCAWSPSCPG